MEVENQHCNFDIIVVGAGPAGVCAAIQASEAGAKTLLIEKTGICGGTTVSAGVNFPGLFHAWGKQIISGIGWCLVTKAVKEAGGEFPDYSDFRRKHWLLHTHINPYIYSAAVEEELINAGVEVLYHTMPAEIKRHNNSWDMTICCKEGLKKISAKILIDCTGDANLAELAGLPTQQKKILQPGTLIFHCSGYKFDSLNIEEININFEKAVTEGRIKWSDIGQKSDYAVKVFLELGGKEKNHIPDVKADTSKGKTTAEIKGRASLMRILRFFRTQPGLENFTVDSRAPECGIRETKRIIGKKTIKAEDYLSGKLWDDAVCYSFYPIDIHDSKGNGIDIRPLNEGIVPTIPLEAMIPQSSQNFLVAGRAISGDSVASSAYRIQPSCMAMGQAAGATAVMAIKTGKEIMNIPIDDIKNLLKKHNAIVPGDSQ